MDAVMVAGTEIEESTAAGMSGVIGAGRTRVTAAFGDCTTTKPSAVFGGDEFGN